MQRNESQLSHWFMTNEIISAFNIQILYISGDLRDDIQPEFLREFHKALAVVSGDLFFARYRFQSETAHSLKEKSSTSTLSAAKGMLIHVSPRDSMHTMSSFNLLIFVYFCDLTI